MLEATIIKCSVLQDQKSGSTVVMGVAQYGDDMINFKAAYNWETMDKDGFIEDLREQIALGFDLPVYRVDVKARKLLDKMCQYSAACYPDVRPDDMHM